MPRAKVAPGRASKRSCSSASSWRGANLRLCATSANARPRASRAAASSCPTPVISVKLASLQGLVLRRGGITPAQLVRVGLLGHPVPQPVLDAQREPQRFGARGDELVVARDQPARLAGVALLVADLAEVEQRCRLVGLGLERALEERFGVLGALQLEGAHSRRRIGAPRRAVERVAQRGEEVLDRLFLAAGLAQEPAVVVVDVAVVRRQPQRALEARLGALVVLHLHVDQPVHAVRRRIVGIRRDRGAQLLESDAEVAVAEIQRGQLGAQLRAVPRIADLADDGPGVVLGRLRRASSQQREEQERSFHARTSFRARLRRVRSFTSPASWPHAAAMSSPRVLRVVTVSPARCITSAKPRIRSGCERLKPEFGNGLNGIRLNLLRTLAARSTSSRAWLSLSFTPSSITYSKVMKSRGAFSR